MSIDNFLDNPGRYTHPAYNMSMFNTVAPEYATSEVLLGSVYRRLLLGISDSSVALEKIPELPGQVPGEFGSQQLWETLLLEAGGIASPAKGGQKGSIVLHQLMPIVPEMARYGCVLGKHGRSRWYPGNLLLQLIGAGRGKQDGTTLVRKLGDALSVGENDDIFAQYVTRGLEEILVEDTTPSYLNYTLTDSEVRAYRGRHVHRNLSPAERFCLDLEHVISLKSKLTRRQWTVMLEAVIRLGLGMHILWVCHVNTIAWDLVLSVAENGQVPTEEQVERELWQSHRTQRPLLEVGRDAVPYIRQLIKKYIHARFGLNLLFYRLGEIGMAFDLPVGSCDSPNISSPQAVCLFLEHVAQTRHSIDSINAGVKLRSQCAKLVDGSPRLADFKSGFSSNMLEFVRYSLGQIDTQNPEQRSYDQSYLLLNKRTHRTGYSPWPVQPGPAMLIMLVYASCQSQGEIPNSLDDFRLHLADYGLHTPSGELATGHVGSDLKKLGLVVDSPDAAGGRLVVTPF